MSLCLGDWHPELPFFMTWRLSRHFCFRPSNFTASWGPRANSGKAHPFCSSTCILAGLHKLLTYRSCSNSVWIIQLLKLSRERSLQATQCTLAHERKGLGRGCKANNNNKKTLHSYQSHSAWRLIKFFFVFSIRAVTLGLKSISAHNGSVWLDSWI